MVFEQAIQRAEQAKHLGDDAAALWGFQAGIAIYSGDLLANVYADWVITARQRLREQFVGALQGIIVFLQARSDYAEAIRYTQQLLRYDPPHETSYRQLIDFTSRLVNMPMLSASTELVGTFCALS